MIISMAVALALAGCGDRNDKAVFGPESGHLPDWTAVHKTSAKADLESCVECHGANLDGGISSVSCSMCHLGGSEAIHPIQWGNYAYARHKSYSTAQRSVSCANAVCHGADLAGFGDAPNCANKCHIGGTYKKHPADWTSISSHKNYVNANPATGSTSCKTSACHGINGKGVFLSGPACDQCHPMK